MRGAVAGFLVVIDVSTLILRMHTQAQIQSIAFGDLIPSPKSQQRSTVAGVTVFCITHNRCSFEGRIAGVVIYRVALHLNACADGKGRREFILPLYVRNQHKGRSIRIPARAELPVQFACGIKIQRTIYKRVIEGKLLILSKMQKIESIGTFINTENGYKVTAPEGFVAIGHDGGAVKLVDRLEFSKQNFAAVKNWKKN